MQNNYPVLELGKELWNRVRVGSSDYFDFEMSEVDLLSYGRRHICTTWVVSAVVYYGTVYNISALNP